MGSPFYDVVFTQQAQRTTYTLGFQGGYIEEYFSADSRGFAKYNQVVGTVTHLLTQRASATLSGRYQRAEYYRDVPTDNLYGADGGISYQLFRWLTLGFNLNYSQNASSGEEEDYKDYRATFRITASY